MIFESDGLFVLKILKVGNLTFEIFESGSPVHLVFLMRLSLLPLMD